MPTYYGISSTRYATYDYDSLNRLNLRTFSTNRKLYNNYVYLLSDRNDTGTRYRTTQLRTEIIDNDAYRYTYDNVGNIIEIEKGNRKNTDTSETDCENYTEYRSYVYDALGQLTMSFDGTKSIQTDISYDTLGNILEQDSFYLDQATLDASTVKNIKYTYSSDTDAGWKNLLTKLEITVPDDEGNLQTTTESFDYDEIGNPVLYRNATLTWRGRQLRTYNEGSTSVSYYYDADGLRGSKTVNGTKTTYYYVGDKLMYESRGNGIELYFFYDSLDKLSSIKYVDETYNQNYYVTTNAQGDVLGIYSSAGVLKASYEYDAWGNATVTDHNSGIDIGNVNPIRYRGYYYDTETGLYYLQSRYYEPRIGRFLNRDDITDSNGGVLGYNLFAYCANNPVNCADPTGHGIIWDWIKEKIDAAVKFIDSAPGRILAYCSDVENKSNLYGKLDNLIKVKDVVDYGAVYYTAQNDIQTHAENVVRVAQNPNYKVRELSDNIAIDYDSYALTCKGTASNLRDYAPMTYNKPISEFTEADIAKFAKNLSAEDKAFWGLLNEAYGEKCVGFVMEFSLP